MSHFYLTLPSNASMKIYANNTVAKYTTQLAKSIELDGDWEVALTEFQYPHSFANVRGEWFQIVVDKKWGDKVMIKDGYYPTVESLMKEVTSVLEEEADKLGLYIPISDIMNPPGTTREDLVYGVASRLLCRLYSEEQTSIAGSPTSTLFVYCDVMENVPVGDTLAPLLRSVVVRGMHGDRVCDRFVHPMYLPVQKKSFDTIEINIMSDTGDPIPFADGRSLVTLHFRRSSSPYFLPK